VFNPRADPAPVVVRTSADWSEQPVHNGPTTSPAPMRLVLVTKSRRLRRWLSDLLGVLARSRLGISCSHRFGFNVSNVAGEPRRCLPDPRCLLPEMTDPRGNREWILRRDLDSLTERHG